MAVDALDLRALPTSDRRVITWVGGELDRLGCEITAIIREPGSPRRWQVQWRPKDIRVRTPCFGASGNTLASAAESVLANALEFLEQPDHGRVETYPMMRSVARGA